MEEAFTYIFEILEQVFTHQQEQEQQYDSVEERKSVDNIVCLRRHYQCMKKMNDCYDMTVVNRFARKLLKNTYILGLYRKYTTHTDYKGDNIHR